MSTSTRILMSVGTRPEIIKMAPVYLELKERGVAPMWLHTGQHDDMAQELYKLWKITPDFNIELQRQPADPTNCDLSMLTALLLEKTSRVLIEANPSIVMVHGDTSSALAMALAAFYRKLTIAHIEAGLRSGDEYHPFPEEKNRMLITQLAHLHFAPTINSEANLLREGIAKEHIHTVGNTIVQATQMGAGMLSQMYVKSASMGTKATHHIGIQPSIITTLASQIQGKRLVLVTAHRRENHGEGISNIAQALIELLKSNEDMVVVWPMHPNPKVQNSIKTIFAHAPESLMERVHLTQPLGYSSLLWILKNAWITLTDSGGIQEEAVALNVPVLVLRETTERPEVVESGAGLLVGTNIQTIIDTVHQIHQDNARYLRMRSANNPFGDHLVAKRICDVVLTGRHI